MPRNKIVPPVQESQLQQNPPDLKEPVIYPWFLKKKWLKVAVLIVFFTIFFFLPLPYYQAQVVYCKPCPPPPGYCSPCPSPGWHFGPSIARRLFPAVTSGPPREESSTFSPTPTPNPTASWKIYRNENVTFKFPSRWIEKPILPRGNGFYQDFEDPEGKFTFTFSGTGNYSQLTGKPYATLDEFINMPYQVKKVTIDGQEGRQPLPRAGGENINLVYFFSKDSKIIYGIGLETGNTPLDTSETDVKEGQKLFNQILSTFKFLD